jgi:uncharacterized protein YjaG (DUF416 family)
MAEADSKNSPVSILITTDYFDYILFCNIQNQDNQDYKIYRMLLDDFW